jgi:hypothetical protein
MELVVFEYAEMLLRFESWKPKSLNLRGSPVTSGRDRHVSYSPKIVDHKKHNVRRWCCDTINCHPQHQEHQRHNKN